MRHKISIRKDVFFVSFFDFHNKIKSKNKFDIAENKILNYFCLTLRLVKL